MAYHKIHISHNNQMKSLFKPFQLQIGVETSYLIPCVKLSGYAENVTKANRTLIIIKSALKHKRARTETYFRWYCLSR